MERDFTVSRNLKIFWVFRLEAGRKMYLFGKHLAIGQRIVYDKRNLGEDKSNKWKKGTQMKRILGWAMALLMCTSFAAAAAEPPVLQSRQAVLYCAENGQVLFDQEMDTPAHPASITKLMTALLVLESGIDLDQTVTVSHDAVYSIERGSTHIALDEGEQVTLEQMMYAMLLTSANDAANVLAEAVDGTQQAFAKHMTERAKELGCRHTNFVNAHGLDDRLHYTTAYDMACITRELLQYDTFLTIAGTQVYTMPPTNKQSEPRSFWNKQNILNPQSEYYDPSAIAGKNGYTSQAGHTLVTVARRDGVTLIAVVLGDDKTGKLVDTTALFAYGYDQFHKTELSAQTIVQKAEEAGLSPDADAVQAEMILLPKDKKPSALTYTARDDALLVDAGAGDPLLLEVPQDTVPTGAAQAEPKEDGHSVPGTTEKVFWIGAGVVGGLVVLVAGLSYRRARIRKRRRISWMQRR